MRGIPRSLPGTIPHFSCGRNILGFGVAGRGKWLMLSLSPDSSPADWQSNHTVHWTRNSSDCRTDLLRGLSPRSVCCEVRGTHVGLAGLALCLMQLLNVKTLYVYKHTQIEAILFHLSSYQFISFSWYLSALGSCHMWLSRPQLSGDPAPMDYPDQCNWHPNHVQRQIYNWNNLPPSVICSLHGRERATGYLSTRRGDGRLSASLAPPQLLAMTPLLGSHSFR